MRPFDECGEWGAKQKKEYILDPQGNKIYDPKKRPCAASRLSLHHRWKGTPASRPHLSSEAKNEYRHLFRL